jgi:hypothetical protein
MASPVGIGVLFLALAAIFLVTALRAGKGPGDPSPARTARLRIAVVFAAVGAVLELVHLLSTR